MELKIDDLYKIRFRKGLLPYQSILTYKITKITDKYVFFTLDDNTGNYKYSINDFKKFLMECWE
jgi:hypothetical protein